jgi:hypothetical protein
MNRENLIKRLVDRKLASNAKNLIGCVPCLGGKLRVDGRRPEFPNQKQ